MKSSGGEHIATSTRSPAGSLKCFSSGCSCERVGELALEQFTYSMVEARLSRTASFP
jgi:hypothetical protein